MTTPYNLEALMAKVREGQLVDRPRPAPCRTWCRLEHGPYEPTLSLGAHCTCTEPCQFEGCPMDVEAYVPPAVPRFREDAA